MSLTACLQYEYEKIVIYAMLLLTLRHVEELHLKMRPSFSQISSRQDLCWHPKLYNKGNWIHTMHRLLRFWFLSWRYLDPDPILWPKNHFHKQWYILSSVEGLQSQLSQYRTQHDFLFKHHELLPC